jgi:hypothetical protein
MANDARVAIWSGVPDGAQLLISVKGTTPASLVTARALVLPGNGEKKRLGDADLQPGPAAVALISSARRYTVLLDLVFTTDGTAEVIAEVVDGGHQIPPDGSAEGQFTSTLPGSKGQSLPVTFVVVMA